jgi:hypothetical protein
MEIIGGGLKEGRVRFARLKNDYFITIDKSGGKLLSTYRKLNSSEKEKFLLDAKWTLNNPKNFRDKKLSLSSDKAIKEKNIKKLAHAANFTERIAPRK